MPMRRHRLATAPGPQAAVSSPIPTIKVARRFMANLPSVAVTPTLGLPANRRLTVASRFVHRAGLGKRQDQPKLRPAGHVTAHLDLAAEQPGVFLGDGQA